MSHSAVCHCDSLAGAKWCYCEDDSYCPQCGQKIARLISKTQPNWKQGDGRPIYVYPSNIGGKPGQHAVLLQLEFVDTHRRLSHRAPNINIEHSFCEGGGSYFSRFIEAETRDAKTTCIRLIRMNEPAMPVGAVGPRPPEALGNPPPRPASTGTAMALPVQGGTLTTKPGSQKVPQAGLVPGTTVAEATLPKVDSNPVVDASSNYLPDQGLNLELHLTGDFPSVQIPLKVSNSPAIRIRLDGRGIEADTSDWQHIFVTASEIVDVNLEISAEHGPLLATEDFDQHSLHCIPMLEDRQDLIGAVALDLESSFRTGTELIPGQKSWRSKARMDASKLREGDAVYLKFERLKRFEGLQGASTKGNLPPRLLIERVDKGRVEVSPPFLEIPVMYFGEYRSNDPTKLDENPDYPDDHSLVIRTVLVGNSGRNPIELEIESAQSAQGENWIFADWFSRSSQNCIPGVGRRVTLRKDEHARIYIKIDLRTLKQASISPKIPNLVARIPIRQLDKGEAVSETVVVVHVNSVRERTECPEVLCIDFGNTNSYAAMRRPPATSDGSVPIDSIAKDEIVPLHETKVPESFATAIFYRNFASDDETQWDYEIGNQAVSLADVHTKGGGPGTLVTDLKRWVCTKGAGRTISDALGNSKYLEIAQIVRHYLRAIILRAEAILRGHWITRVCLSHPSKRGPKERLIMSQVIDQLCKDLSDESFRRPPMQQQRSDVDEANAVAVDAVLTNPQCKEYLKAIVKGGKRIFTVAAIDVGGGSLDTAVIRFELHAQTNVNFPRYKTHYLGIGGYRDFGGDNVTHATMELLKDRITPHLSKSGLDPSQIWSAVPLPHQRETVDLKRRNNYDFIWNAAEMLKISLCSSPSKDSCNAIRAKVQTLIADNMLLDVTGGTPKLNEPAKIAINKFIEANLGEITLDDIYGIELEADLLGEPVAYCVKKRIEDAVREVEQFALDHGHCVDIVVVCGASSRLPIVLELIRQILPHSAVLHDKHKTKQGVARGLVTYLRGAAGRHSFVPSSAYTSSVFLIGDDTRQEVLGICVPNCVSLNDGVWYQIKDPETLDMIPFSLLDVDMTQIKVYRSDPGARRYLHGYFDILSETKDPAQLDRIQLAMSGELGLLKGEVRLNGSEDSMILRLSLERFEMEEEEAVVTEILGEWNLTTYGDE